MPARTRTLEQPEETSPAPGERPLGAPIRLGIDADALRRPLSGVGRYVQKLAAELEKLLPEHSELLAYTRLPAERLALPSDRWIVRREPLSPLRRLPSFAWLRTRGAALCVADDIDVFWAGRTLHPRLPRSIRTVVSVHDLNHLIVPRTMQRATRWSHRLWFAADLAQADCVIANSEGTSARLHDLLGVRTDAVVRPGLEPEFDLLEGDARMVARAALAELGVRPPYLLSVATLEPRKNVDAVLAAFLSLRREGKLSDHQLVVAGAGGWESRKLEQALARAEPLGVRRLGYVPDRLLPALYGLCELLLLPSLYEGFGMPALEARACGARVLVSDVPELREAAGPGGVVVSPTEGGIARGILHALDSPPPTALVGEAREALGWRRGARKLASLLARP